MVRIDLSPLDKKDLLELLDYAKEQKIANKPEIKSQRANRWDDTNFWLLRISQLKAVINGKPIYDNTVKSSMPDFEITDRDNDFWEGLKCTK
jgi:hypothetical protein